MSTTQERKEIVFITGATSGLGRLTAKKCIDLGLTVIIAGRSQASLDDASKIILKDSAKYKDNLFQVIMDLGDLSSVKKGVESLESFNLPCIDVIVHNAGLASKTFEQVAGVEKTVFVNSVAPIYLNNLLMPYLEKSQNPKKRILIVASGLHHPERQGVVKKPEDKLPENGVTLEDLASNPEIWTSMRYYRISKLANVWSAYALAERNPDIPVAVFCPGFVPTTGLGRNAPFVLKFMMNYILPFFSFTVSADESTNQYIYYITSDEIKTATYYASGKPEESSKESRDKEKQEIWWKFANEAIDNVISR